jgi:4-amino-4-deoxy-L-arabinose transferase-like glycosyltransferase
MSSASAARRGGLGLDPAVVRALRRHRVLAAVVFGAVAACVLWVVALPHNPPCCYNDESSTNYNAWLIAHGGRDEYGAHFPLYFRAFGEFRSPFEIYLLAGLLKVFGAHELIGRYVTRAAMFLAVLLVGWLAARISGRRWIGLAVAALGLTTPMLYEVSRLGTEAPVFDLPLAIFLFALWGLSRRERWPWWHGALLALPLVVMAYTYPIGRPLSPLFAAGLLLFVRRPRWGSIGACWVVLAAAMVPILLFSHHHPGALTGYPGELSWYSSDKLPFRAAGEFVSHLARNLNPVAVLADGDPNVRHHVGPVGAVLAPFWLLSLAGLVLVVVRRRTDAWWRYVVFAQALVLVPGVLTRDVLHTPRLIAVPILGLVLCVPALQALAEPGPRQALRRVLGGALVAGAVVEAVVFAAAYVRDGTNTDRAVAFQGDFLPAYVAAAKTGVRPIWLLDNASIHGFYQGVIAGEACKSCRVLFAGPNFTTWIQK